MISRYRGRPGRNHEPIGDLRTRMIAETEVFLNWALTHGHAVPRIPRRRVSRGGFAAMLAQPGGRERIGRWWDRTLGTLLR